MRRAVNLLRPEPHFRRECFTDGLRSAGFDVVDQIKQPKPDDVLLTWNRGSSRNEEAKRFESAGCKVIVTENPYLPVRHWYSLALGHHMGRGTWPVGGAERWDALGVELRPWREGEEVVILAQRGIGEPAISQPKAWPESVRRATGGRIRAHPKRAALGITLEQDLAKASSVVTWGSTAALIALTMGIPAFYGLSGWIGAPACLPVAEFATGPLRDDTARLQMFERLAWAMAPIPEIRDGTAIRRLLDA